MLSQDLIRPGSCWPGQRGRLLSGLRPCPVASVPCCSRRAAVMVMAAKKGDKSRGSSNKVSSQGLEPPPLAQAPQVSSNSSPPPEQPQLLVTPSLTNNLGSTSTPPSSNEDQGQALKILWRRLLIDLSSLPRAIALMAITFGFSALGTVIPQNKAFDYYIQNYPEEGEKVLGFLTYNWIFALELDHIYTAWYFYLTLAWLAASLMACTSTRQWPAVKVAQRWRFQGTPVGVARQGADGKGIAEVLPGAKVSDLGMLLMKQGYQVFLQDSQLYAFKGLAGKIGPIGVHAAMLLIMAGTCYSALGGFKGTVMLPEGEDVVLTQVLRPVSPLAIMPSAADNVLHVNKFSIDYRPDGQVAQFYSDMSLVDPRQPPSAQQLAQAPSLTDTQEGGVIGKEVLRKTISVNDPFRYSGITMYQTDWSLSSVKIRVLGPADSSPAGADSASSSSSSSTQEQGTSLTLPMASLEGRPGIAGRLWGSYLPVAAPSDLEQQEGRAPRGVSILARDPQSIIFYDTKGAFVGVRRPGSGKPIEVEGVRLVAEEVIGATGLEIKNDPGVPLVYAGFGGLMVTTLVSYLSHSQVWALQQGSTVYVAGRSNRAKLAFNKEMNEILDAVPEAP